MEHRSADWPRGAASGDSSPADQVESASSDAGEDAAGEDAAGEDTIGEDTAGEDTAVEDTGVAQPGTGEPRVDAAMRLLDKLDAMPVSAHPELYEQVHAQLSDVLGELDTGPGS